MDETKMIQEEHQVAIQVKSMFKDIKELKISEPDINPMRGGINFGIKVTLGSGKIDNVGVTIGDTSGYANGAYLQEGKTDTPIKVIYSNGKEELING
ncbi:MAG: hypothetical protein LBI13_04795 [Streptococcaceae bacterium]|nr:hypothetical protein [Streptococcaceae bacterium]